MAKINPKYFDRSPVSIRRATKFMRTPFDFCTRRYNIVQGVFCNMVKKEEERRLGRPRSYDPEVALQRATAAFWDGGFSGTSLDDLSERTGMNRPSLYAAFGDKEALYLKTLESYLAARRDRHGARRRASASPGASRRLRADDRRLPGGRERRARVLSHRDGGHRSGAKSKSAREAGQV